MLDRKDFLKKCAMAVCAPGLCGTAAAATGGAGDAKELEAANRKIGEAQDRFAGLLAEIDRGLPPEEGNRLLNAAGRRCAKACCAGFIERYRGNLEGFLAKAKTIWMAEAHYDEAAGVLRIADKPGCTCPLAKIGTTPGKLCECSLGWQEQAYSTVLGRPVKAELEESILRGGKQCRFRITAV
jgi:hypothetical protein